MPGPPSNEPPPLGAVHDVDDLVMAIGQQADQSYVFRRQFRDPTFAYRRLFAEVLGTFLLVLVAAGGDMVDEVYAGSIGRAAAVVAPGLMVMAIILFMGKVSGAHLNPAVSIGFALRRDFPWRGVGPYIAAQAVGAALACAFLQALLDVSARFGGTYPGAATSEFDAMLFEAVLTFGLVSVILGTASGAQNVGVLGAVAVGGYIALAGLWASPPSGASMNPVRSLGPDLVGGDWHSWWVYVAGPIVGAIAAVGAAWILRGPGGDPGGRAAAMGAPVLPPIRPNQDDGRPGAA